MFYLPQRYCLALISFSLLFFVTPLSLASEESGFAPQVATLILQAEDKKLAEHPYWRKLLHYKYPGSGHDSVRSEIISSDFFLSPEGTINPSAEIKATIAAFFASPGDEPDKHAQCRFVARYQWLRRSLDWSSADPPSVTCHQFEDWALHSNINSLSLVFASGYLSNPASFYGHILLKFNTDNNIAPTNLLDESVNYGATVPEHENGLAYAFKGVFGGYDGSFSHERFYRLNHIYVENEMRDLWEYELSLSPAEVDAIVAHAWELLGNKFTYYFLKENCAYRMAELLNLVIEPPLVPYDRPWEVPAVIFDKLASIERNGTPLVSNVHRIPSRQNLYSDRYFELSESSQTQVRFLVANNLNFTTPSYQQNSNDDKVRIIDTLIDYYEFRLVTNKSDPSFKAAKHTLLLERSGLPPQTSVTIDPESDIKPPHIDPRPGMTRAGFYHNNQLGSGFELRWRPAYYDMLNLDAGRYPNSQLSMLDLRLIYSDQSLSVRSLDIINIETLNPSRTSLPGDGGIAWKVKAGLENRDLSCENCLVSNITGGIGKSATLMNHMVTFVMLEANARTKRQDSDTFGIAAHIGMIASPIPGWKSHISLGQQAYLNGSRSNYRLARWENRFGTARNWDVRLNFEEKIARESQLAISYYW
ncbi:MAG: DUF4105 domain-containing protein [Gammaproteobacteria bacterium]|nr:DUF4105 domain-containing protein [Gammaproteobacteria bacterium]